MQFKRAGNRIQIIAYAGYNKEKRRSDIKVLGSMGYDMEPTDELLSKMTDEQKKELQSYIEEKRQEREKSILQYNAKTLDSRISSVYDSLASGEFAPDDAWGERVYAAMDDLRKAMRKVGLKRQSKPVPAAPAVQHPGQLDLDAWASGTVTSSLNKSETEPKVVEVKPRARKKRP